MARSRASVFKAQQYWVYEAHKRDEACDLAHQLNLGLPNGSPGGNECDIMYPLHRLVVTGQDTTTNLRLLFGATADDDVTEPHARARQTVLLNLRSGLVDDEAPYIRPRRASRAEQDALDRQLQFGREYRGLLPHCFGGSSRDDKKKREAEVMANNSRHSNSKRQRGQQQPQQQQQQYFGDTGSGYPSPEWMETSE